MEKRITYITIIFITIFLNGCFENNSSSNGLISDVPFKESETQNGVFITHNPTPKEILEQSPDADIFLYKDAVVQNANDIEWVQKLKLSKGELIGEIISQYKSGTKFEQGMATKLPIGTKVYKTKERNELLLIEKDGKYICYLMLLEG